MKGFILKINRAKNEDIVVRVLTQDSVKSYYRFYGARHSVLQLGYLIDFEVQEDSSSFLPRIRNITHNGFKWLYDREKLMDWHRFIHIFEEHFRDVDEIDRFYFETLLDCAKKWDRQSPKRLAIEAFVNILKYEGRLYSLYKCLKCGSSIENNLSLIKGFIPAHSYCSNAKALPIEAIEELFKSGSTLFIDDDSVEMLFNIVTKGFNN